MGRKGFTLIEVLVTMVILAIGLLAIVQMTLVYVNANTFNNMLSQATVIGQEKMEHLTSYARSDRADTYSTLDFDYLISASGNFTSLRDVSGGSPASFIVHGLLSGDNGGVPVTAPWDANLVFPVLYDDGAHDDVDDGDGIYGLKEVIDVPGMGGAAAFQVERIQRVQPINLEPDPNLPPRFDLARITVITSWTDRYGKKRDVTLDTVVHRRQ
ncbi:prepilin-type N-terminal cleavage/methylation domain-containing protein [bacterium]|nr:MAG: prepilin-type N-terminal cleavage/methylation domain-containing protein [bacterium]